MSIISIIFLIASILLLVAVITVVIVVITIKNRANSFLKENFGTTNLKEIERITELDEESTPKSVAGMENIFSPLINKDFPHININELKRMAENHLLSFLTSDEFTSEHLISDKVRNVITTQIKTRHNTNTTINNISFHRTVINSYKKNSNVATITFNTSLEYYLTDDTNQNKRTQERFQTEFIYIIKDPNNKTVRAFGLNCPNCGAPVETLENKICTYCGTGVIDIVKKNWILNDIKKY